jgi:hypothetical protein
MEKNLGLYVISWRNLLCSVVYYFIHRQICKYNIISEYLAPTSQFLSTYRTVSCEVYSNIFHLPLQTDKPLFAHMKAYWGWRWGYTVSSVKWREAVYSRSWIEQIILFTRMFVLLAVTSSSDKLFGVVDIGQWELKGDKYWAERMGPRAPLSPYPGP